MKAKTSALNLRKSRLVAAPKSESSKNYHFAFTLDERDKVDLAKSRIRTCVLLVNPDTPEWEYDEDYQHVAALATDILRDAIETIDETFKAANERQERAKKGKAA
jgi:hypothetical protein